MFDPFRACRCGAGKNHYLLEGKIYDQTHNWGDNNKDIHFFLLPRARRSVSGVKYLILPKKKIQTENVLVTPPGC